MALARRLLSFSTIPAASALMPFLILPVLARSAGAEAWLAVAVGQSVGGFLALAVGLGLNVVGPTLIGRESDDEVRRDLFALGTRARLLPLAPALVLGGVVAAALAPAEGRLIAATMAAAITLGGVSSAWFLVGVGRPLPLLGYELLPRALATAGGAVVLLTGGSALWYPVLLLAAILLGIVGFVRTVAPWRTVLGGGWGRSARFARAQLGATATETVSGAYTSLAVSFVTLGTTTAHAAAYVSGDKLFRMGQTVIGTLGNALQGWVVEDGAVHLHPRVRRALLLHAALGVFGLAAFALLGPWLTAVLFGEATAMDAPTAALFGVAVLCISLTTCLGRHLLVPLGHTRMVLLSVIAGAVAGVPLTIALSAAWGSVGGATGLALAEAVVLIVQTMAALALRPSRKAA